MARDPQLKSLIVDLLEDFIYGKLKQHWLKELCYIHQENNKILGTNTPDGFWYKTELYIPGESLVVRTPGKLSYFLWERMDDYLEQKKSIENNEKVYVMGYIIKTLNLSNNINDYFKLLPEVLHNSLKQIHESYLTTPIPSLSQDVINKHIYSHTKEINLLKTRLVNNLIM